MPKMEFFDLAKLKISIVNFSFKPAGWKDGAPFRALVPDQDDGLDIYLGNDSTGYNAGGNQMVASGTWGLKSDLPSFAIYGPICTIKT